ncbi:MAG: hypothetical protein WDW36_004253 [Sanguina aurantia]
MIQSGCGLEHKSALDELRDPSQVPETVDRETNTGPRGTLTRTLAPTTRILQVKAPDPRVPHRFRPSGGQHATADATPGADGEAVPGCSSCEQGTQGRGEAVSLPLPSLSRCLLSSTPQRQGIWPEAGRPCSQAPPWHVQQQQQQHQHQHLSASGELQLSAQREQQQQQQQMYPPSWSSDCGQQALNLTPAGRRAAASSDGRESPDSLTKQGCQSSSPQLEDWRELRPLRPAPNPDPLAPRWQTWTGRASAGGDRPRSPTASSQQAADQHASHAARATHAQSGTQLAFLHVATYHSTLSPSPSLGGSLRPSSSSSNSSKVARTHPTYSLQGCSGNSLPPVAPRSRLATFVMGLVSLLKERRLRSTQRSVVSSNSVSTSEASLSPCGSERWPCAYSPSLAAAKTAATSKVPDQLRVQASPSRRSLDANQLGMAHVTLRHSMEGDSPCCQLADPQPPQAWNGGREHCSAALSCGKPDPRRPHHPNSRFSSDSRTPPGAEQAQPGQTSANASLAASSLLYRASAIIADPVTTTGQSYSPPESPKVASASSGPRQSVSSLPAVLDPQVAATARFSRILEHEPSTEAPHVSSLAPIYSHLPHIGGVLEKVSEGPTDPGSSPLLHRLPSPMRHGRPPMLLRAPSVPTSQPLLPPAPSPRVPGSKSSNSPPPRPPSCWGRLIARLNLGSSAPRSPGAATTGRGIVIGGLHALPRGVSLEEAEADMRTSDTTLVDSEAHWSVPGGFSAVDWSRANDSSAGGDAGFAQEAMDATGSMPWCISNSRNHITQTLVKPPPQQQQQQQQQRCSPRGNLLDGNPWSKS